jgi:hypothetical protein
MRPPRRINNPRELISLTSLPRWRTRTGSNQTPLVGRYHQRAFVLGDVSLDPASSRGGWTRWGHIHRPRTSAPLRTPLVAHGEPEKNVRHEIQDVLTRPLSGLFVLLSVRVDMLIHKLANDWFRQRVGKKTSISAGWIPPRHPLFQNPLSPF